MSVPSFPNRSSIEADQLTKLRTLVSALLKSNLFYSQRLRDAGVSSDISDFDNFQSRISFTLKQELVENQLESPPYGTNLTYPLERYTHYSQTSGTTGQPLRWLDTPESWDWMLSNWEQVYRAAGVTFRDHVFFAFSFGPFLGFWLAFESAERIGCLCLPGGGIRSAARLRIMMDNGVTVLCCTPTYALRLAEVAREERIDLSAGKLRAIIVAGEPGGSIPSTRAHLEDLWYGARVVDHHGMTEIGPVSYNCPKRRDVLHVIESGFIAEVIDPNTGRPAAPGGVGELVLTNLGRIGSPLLRYRTGDLVQPAENQPCECGSYELALLGGILGRTDDTVAVRGVNVHPSAVEDIVRMCKGVAEYRVEIRTDRALPELSLIIEPLPDLQNTTHLVEQLEAALRTTFSLRIPVFTVPSGTLPRFELKARRWVRL